MILRETKFNNITIALFSENYKPYSYYTISNYLIISPNKNIHCGGVACRDCPFTSDSGCESEKITIKDICDLFGISPEDHPEYFI